MNKCCDEDHDLRRIEAIAKHEPLHSVLDHHKEANWICQSFGWEWERRGCLKGHPLCS